MHSLKTRLKTISTYGMLVTLLLSACKDDPQPVNEEEVITTVIVDLVPQSGGAEIRLKWYDENGDGNPVITPSVATLTTGTVYDAQIILMNETVSPAEDITEEIETEGEDHLFCFTVAGADVTIAYEDADGSGDPIGLSTAWTAGAAGNEGSLTLVLRHQPGQKDGTCPGAGETDIEVSFPIRVME
jgi:hypothetical protein